MKVTEELVRFFTTVMVMIVMIVIDDNGDHKMVMSTNKVVKPLA